MSRRLQLILAAASYLLLALALQWNAGTGGADFTLHPDEPAHLVTGMMVRDYVAQHLGESPLPFAKTYYATYPKIAIGHYPPMFYIVEGAWFLVWPPSPMSAAALMAALAALLAWSAFAWNPLRLSLPASWFAGALCLLMPLSINAMLPVMADHLLAIFIIAASAAWQRFCDTETKKSALLFGLAAGAAILTKASGLLLAGLPVVTLLLLRRWHWLRKPAFYIAALVTGVVGGPWTIATLHITQEGAISTPWREYITLAPAFYARSVWDQTHWLVVIGAILGVGRLLWNKLDSGSAIVLSLPVIVWAFFSLIPAGWEQRYMLPTLPLVTMLAVHGLRLDSSSEPPLKTWSADLGHWLGIGFWLVSCLTLFLFDLPHKQAHGFRRVVTRALASSTPRAILIISDPRGEGAAIAEAALLNPRRPSPPLVLRGTQVLGSSDWLGRDYKARVGSAAELAALVKEKQIDLILWDGSVPSTKLIPFHPPVHEWLTASPQAFERIDTEVITRDFPHTDEGPHQGTLEVWRPRLAP